MKYALMRVIVHLILLLFALIIVGTTATFFFQPPSPPMPPATNIMLSSSRSGMRDLVNNLKREGVVKHKQVIDVMNQVDRKNYISQFPYHDTPQRLDCGQTISAPHMHGYALEIMLPYLLESPRDTVKMLDVGCGSGYLTATMGRWVHSQNNDGATSIVPKKGLVYGMDIFPHLVDLTRSNLMKDDADLLESGIVHLKTGNGWQGWPEEGPFDAIHVGAAASDFPAALAKQLALGGVMVIPIGPQGVYQYLCKVERVAETGKIETDFKTTRMLGVSYVPLIHEPEEYL